MKQRLMIVWAIAHKDMLDALKQQYLLFSLSLPILLSLALSFIPQDAGAANALNVVVYDPGESQFIATLQALPEIELSRVSQLEDVLAPLQADHIGGLIIPANFDAEIQTGQQPELVVSVNGERSIVEQQLFRRLIEQQVWELVEQPARINWIEQNTTSPTIIQAQHATFISMIVFALPLTGIFLVPLLIVEEKEKQTLQALLVSPARPIEIALGKAMTGVVYSAAMVAILLVMQQGWQGDWLVSMVVLFMGALAMVTLGLILGSLFRTSMQVNTWSGLLLLIFMVPIVVLVFDMPLFVTAMLYVLPTYHLVEVLQLSLAGETATAPLQVVSSIVMLLLITLGAFGVVAWLLRREES